MILKYDCTFTSEKHDVRFEPLDNLGLICWWPVPAATIYCLVNYSIKLKDDTRNGHRRVFTVFDKQSLLHHANTPIIILTLLNPTFIMRKLAFCTCENRGADQLRGYSAAQNHLSLRCIGITIPIHPKFQVFSCAAQFVLDFVRHSKDKFSHDAALIYPVQNSAHLGVQVNSVLHLMLLGVAR